MVNKPPKVLRAQNSGGIIYGPGTDTGTDAGGGNVNQSNTMIIGGQSNQPQSLFIAATNSSKTIAEGKKAVETAVQSFVPFGSFKAALKINPSLAEFGEWMSSFSAETPVKELLAKRQNVKPLSPADEINLWDNLYYLAIKEADSKTADAIILMIRANAFLKELNEVNLREEIAPATVTKLRRLANALVAMPSQLVSAEKKASVTGAPFVDAESEKCLLRCSNRDVAKATINKLRSYISELNTATLAYQAQETAAFQKATEVYQQKIEQLLESHQGNRKGESTSSRQTATVDDLIAMGVKLPRLDYTAGNPFSDEFIKNNLSPETAKAVKLHKKAADTAISNVITTIEAELAKQYTNFIDNYDKGPQTFNYNGLSLTINNQPANNTYVLRGVCVNTSENLYALYLTQYVDNPNAKFKRIRLSVTNGQGKSLTSESLQPVNQTDNYATFAFFEDGIPLDDYKFEADYQAIDTNQTGSFGQPQFSFSRPSFGGTPRTSENDGKPGNDTMTLYGVAKVGIGDFMRVEQEICCYVPGEVSHIENIMAREYKERATRHLTRTETITEETEEREEERLQDTVSTERHELNAEIARVLQQDKSTQIGANASVTASYTGGPQITATAGANFNSTNSSSLNTSFKQAESYAKDVVDHAMRRVVEKMTYKRTSRMLREFEETNKHGFDNRLGENHVTGVYRWVDQIYVNRVMNYGKRLMYNFVVPEPAKNFKHWMKHQPPATTGLPPQPVAPLKLKEDFNIDGPADINRFNYAVAAGAYGVEIEPLPNEQINIGFACAETIDDGKRSGYKYDLEIPAGYYCGDGKFNSKYHPTNDQKANFWVAIGGKMWFDNSAGRLVVQDTFNGWTSEKLAITVSMFEVGSFNMSVLANCHLLPDFKTNWQNDTYIKLRNAYNKKVQEYNDAMAQYNAALDAAQQVQGNPDAPIDYNFNPLTGRAIEQRELKRLCLELMLAPFGLFGFPANQSVSIGENNYTSTNAYGNYNISRNTELTRHASYVKFLEQAFDWNIMAYVFYPYYWGGEGEWAKLIKETSSADYIFQSFLQSGMSNVVVPVMPGFETAVLYFLDTGKLLEDKPVMVADKDDTYADILDGIYMEKPTMVGDPWHTRIPTALTIIQKYSSALDANGLPCGKALNNDLDTLCAEDGNPLAYLDDVKANLLTNAETKDKMDTTTTSSNVSR
ncbi:MAG TPA: hypothetical protein PLW44_01220 [Chitinophagales bacterium]|nr:hypothetical protein [Chitinophagales bacterium]